MTAEIRSRPDPATPGNLVCAYRNSEVTTRNTHQLKKFDWDNHVAGSQQRVIVRRGMKAGLAQQKATVIRARHWAGRSGMESRNVPGRAITESY